MPVGDVRINPDTGDVWRQDRVGNNLEWVRVEGAEAVDAQIAAERGAIGAGLQGLVNSATLGAASGGGVGEAQRQQFPKATLAGQLIPDAAALIAAGLPFAARRAGQSAIRAGSAAERVTEGVARQAGRQLPRMPSERLGRATALGSAARLVEAGAEAVPGLNIPGLLVKAVGQRKTNEAMARTFPGLTAEQILKARKGITPEIIAAGGKGFREGFAEVRAGITQALDEVPDAQLGARTILDAAAENRMVGPKLTRILNEKPELDGADVMALRSELGEFIAGSEQFEVRKVARELQEQLDDIIEVATESVDPEIAAKYKDLRARYRVWANVREGRGLAGDGQVMPTTVAGKFARNYGDRFRAGEQIEGVPNDVQNFLNIIQEGNATNVGLPSSGTAERAAGAAILGGGLALAAGD